MAMMTLTLLPVLLVMLLMLALAICVAVFVYKDAVSRGMPGILWAAVALLVPGLVGLLIYLVVRGNYSALRCAACGQAAPDLPPLRAASGSGLAVLCGLRPAGARRQHPGAGGGACCRPQQPLAVGGAGHCGRCAGAVCAGAGPAAFHQYCSLNCGIDRREPPGSTSPRRLFLCVPPKGAAVLTIS